MTADFKLTENGDLDLTSGRMSLSKDTDAVAQRVINKIYLATGDWDFDLVFGTNWDLVFGAKGQTNIKNADNIIKLAIRETEGVAEILTYKSTLNNKTGEFLIECSIKDVYGKTINLITKK